MSLFDSVQDSSQVQETEDRVKGQRQAPMESDIYNLIIKHAYAQKARSGAMGVHMLLEVADGNHKDRQIRVTEYITSGDAKGNKTYYERDNGKGGKDKFHLPGFTLIDSVCQILTGKSVLQAANEKRTIKLYNFDTKSEVPTEVDMLIDLVGKGVCGCVLHQIQDKTKKNDQTGDYEPTGQTYDTNVVEKYLDPQNRKTAGEIANNLDAAFGEQWLAKWKDQIDDQSTDVKSAGLKGAPAANGEAAPKTNIFG